MSDGEQTIVACAVVIGVVLVWSAYAVRRVMDR